MRDEDLLIGRWDVHVQPLFGDRFQPLAARRVADRALQPDPSRRQRVALCLQPPNLALLPNADHPPSYDARGHEDETDQYERDQ